MLIDLHDPSATAPASDVCIVGAGAAGIPLARRLAAHGHSVCLLESGGLEFEEVTQDLYRGANVGMEYYPLDESRLRFFGGTTRIWGGRCALLDPIDFEHRPWVPNSGWPIGRADLDPYYRLAHEAFDLGEFAYEGDVWPLLGLPPAPFDPARITARLWRFDERHERFGPVSCRDVLDSPRITVVLHANAVHLQAEAGAGRLKHVTVRTLAGATRTVSARHFVLAGGAIENARLLLASRDVEPEGIGNARDQVGRYFMEHPCGRIARVRTPRPFEFWAALQKRFMPSGPPLAPVLALGEATQRAEGALNSIVTLKLQRDPALGVPLTQKIYGNIKHAMHPDSTGRRLDHAYRNIRAWIHRGIRMSYERARSRLGMTHLYLICRGEQAPNPASRVRLSAETDALGSPRAELDWRLSPLDKHAARVFNRTLDAELRRIGMGTLEPCDWVADDDPHWPVDPTVGNHPIAGYHHMGTTRMSADPARGVVDADCRVHGYDNLYVAGSSVFSTSGWANPTLTLVALALRLADHLDRRLG